VTDAQALRAELKKVYVRGYAIDDAEMDTNLTCLAAPIYDSERRIIAAVSISKRQGPVRPKRLMAHLESLQDAVVEVGRRLAPPCKDALARGR